MINEWYTDVLKIRTWSALKMYILSYIKHKSFCSQTASLGSRNGNKNYLHCQNSIIVHLVLMLKKQQFVCMKCVFCSTKAVERLWGTERRAGGDTGRAGWIWGQTSSAAMGALQWPYCSLATHFSRRHKQCHAIVWQWLSEWSCLSVIALSWLQL